MCGYSREEHACTREYYVPRRLMDDVYRSTQNNSNRRELTREEDHRLFSCTLFSFHLSEIALIKGGYRRIFCFAEQEFSYALNYRFN